MAIHVENLGKRYWLQGAAPHTFQQSLANLAGKLAGLLRKRTPFWALREVSKNVAPGESVGIIGHNGAGKTTLLRLIGGLGRPTLGRVQIDGRVAALLELGVGFHPHLTGRENLFVSAVVSGLRRSEVEARYDDIVRFTEAEMSRTHPGLSRSRKNLVDRLPRYVLDQSIHRAGGVVSAWRNGGRWPFAGGDGSL